MIGNVFFFTVALVLTKQVYILNKRISTFEVFFIGTGVQVLIQIPLLKYHRYQFKKHPETQDKLMEIRLLTWPQKKLLYLRLVVAYPGWLMLNYSIQIIPIGVAQTIQNLIPFCVLLIAYLLLGETLHRIEIVNMAVSFCGVLIIVLMSSSSKPALDIGDIGKAAPFVMGVIANALSAIIFAICSVVMRSLRNAHHSLVASTQSSTNFVLSLIGVLLYRLFINPNNFEYNFTASEVCLLLLTGVARAFS